MISKTTVQMAAKRGIALYIQECDPLLNGRYTVEISAIDENGEPADEYDALYVRGLDGLYFHDSCTGNSEEFPAWIADDRSLRGLLDSIAAEITRR